MAGYPPGVPPIPPVPPPGYDPRAQRRYMRDQARAQRDAYRAQRDQMRYQMRGMRRGSVVGPILLIAIGVVFLLIETGRLDRESFWAWYGHWWPLLLVGAGVILLAEWALDQYAMRNARIAPYRRSWGGLVVLVVLIAVAGIFAEHGLRPQSGRNTFFLPGFVLNQDSMDELFGDKHESDQTIDLAYPSGDSLAVVNPHGDVTISGTSDDNRIHIAVHKQVYARSDSDADAKAQQLTPATSTSGSSFTVNLPSLDGARADLVIAVPAASATTVTANHGDIHIASIKAPVAVTANHGDIDLSNIAGGVTAHINSGSSSVSAHTIDGGVTIQGHAQDVTLADITGPVSLTGDFYGTTHFEHINGAIHFHTGRADFQLARLDGQAEVVRDNDISADQVLGPVVLNTHNGNVTLDRVAGDVAVTNHNGTIDLTAAPPVGAITLEDRNDSVRLTLPENAGFSIQATTTNGDIDTDLPLTGPGMQGDTSHGDSEREGHKTAVGTVGGGGPLIRITTSNGDISIHKGEVQPLTPPAPAPKIILVPPAGHAKH